MAGWVKRDNGSSLKECSNTLQKSQETEFCFDFESERSCDGKAECLFNKFLRAFLKEVSGVSCLRPLPPVISEGQIVDLLKLQIVVRKRGGYTSVSENGLWSSVVAECGFDSRAAAALKLVYVKYLDILDRCLRKVDEDKVIRFLMDLKSDSKVFISGIQGKVEIDEGFVEFKKKSLGSINDNLGFVKLNVDVKNVDKNRSSTNRGVNVNVIEKQCVDKGSNGDDLPMEEDSVSRKRKRESYVGLLNWIFNVAKDPCNSSIEPLPEKQKWKCYGSELPWKQIILVRDAMLLKKNVDAGSQQSVWQKKQKMHPGMYVDSQCGAERLRCSQRLLFSKDSSQKAPEKVRSDSSSSGFQSDEDKQPDSTADSATLFSSYRKKRIPIGQHYQADLPEFCGGQYECDSKWLGTRIWPLDKAEHNKGLIERDPMGKGRSESCGCEFPGSIECVRFHVREKRVKVKLELGSAFYLWKFNSMGEDVALSWTKEDERKFQQVVESNRLSSEKYFWDELFKVFPKKGREALVSYYFNVFLLQRRGLQNRSGTSNIDSDDEDSEYGPIGNRFGQLTANTPGSIFCSPKKSHSKSK